METLIFRVRFTLHAWNRGLDFKTAWYCSGESIKDHGLPCDGNDPIEAADCEINYARQDAP